MELAVCVTDDDYEAWRQVRIAVVSGERTNTVAEMREQDSPDRVLMLARMDGRVVGCGLGDRSDTVNRSFAMPRVIPEFRRRGVGSTLLRALADHCAGLGVPEVVSSVDDEGSLAFATRFGFVEVDREVEQVRAVDDAEAPTPLEGVEVVLASQHPELWPASYERFGKEALADFALHAPLEISQEQWETTWLADPMFLAVVDGEVIGCAGLHQDSDRPERAEHALTAVRRDWRGRGIAVHLKQQTLHWARSNGIDEVYTWTQAGNTPMIRLNEQLGYSPGGVGITVSRALPL